MEPNNEQQNNYNSCNLITFQKPNNMKPKNNDVEINDNRTVVAISCGMATSKNNNTYASSPSLVSANQDSVSVTTDVDEYFAQERAKQNEKRCASSMEANRFHVGTLRPNSQMLNSSSATIKRNQAPQVELQNEDPIFEEEEANEHEDNKIKDNENYTDQQNNGSNTILRGLQRRFTNFLPRLLKGNGTRNQHHESNRVVSAVSVPNLSVLAPHQTQSDRSHSDPSMSHSKSIAFGLNRLQHQQDVDETNCHNESTTTPDFDTASMSCSTTSKGSFHKHVNANKARPTRFEPKPVLYHAVSSSASATLPPNLTAPQYTSCLCLGSPTVMSGIVTSSDGSASIYSGSSVATLPLHISHHGRPNPMLDPNVRYRYLTYGTSAQLQQEYGKVLPWPTLTEFRLRRKFRRLKRRARKLINAKNLFSSKSFLVKRFVKRRNSQPEQPTDAEQTLCSHANLAPVSRSSSLTSLLDLIEEANKNLINSFNQSPKSPPKVLQPPKCPPRLKRAQSSINVSTVRPVLRTAVLPNVKPTNQLEEELLWKTNIADYQIAFIDHSQQQQASPSIQASTKIQDSDTISVKSLDSYFGPSSLPSVASPSSTTSPRTSKTSDRREMKAKSKSRTLMVRSHFEINNGTIYLEDSDWEMCSEISEMNSLNLIESQGLDSVSMVPNDSLTDVDPTKEKQEDNRENVKVENNSKSRMKSSSVSLQSNCSTSGFSDSKSDIPVSSPQEHKVELVLTDKHSSASTEESQKPVVVPNAEPKPNPPKKVLTFKEPELEPEAPEDLDVHECEHHVKEKPPVVHQCEHHAEEDQHVYAVPIKKQKPPVSAKPKLATKPKTEEPIYAKPNKSKYPPKHCCIARPAQPPPETPKVRTPLIRKSLPSGKLAPRKKTKAPAPPPPKATIAKPVTKPSSESPNLPAAASVPSATVEKPTPIKAIATVPSHKVAKNSNSSRIRLNNLIKKSTNTNGSNKSAKSTTKTTAKSKAATSSASSKSTVTPSEVQTTTERPTSKSPFKALINRLSSPRNQDEGRSQQQQKNEEVKIKSEKEAQIEQINRTQSPISTESPQEEEPIYSNVSIELESCQNVPIETKPDISAESTLSDLNVSVVDLIDKFNKLNDFPPDPPVLVNPMAPTKASAKEQLANNARFESILANKPSRETPQPTANLEGEFQEYLQQLRSTSPDNLDQKQLIDQLCSELIHKFDKTKINAKPDDVVPPVGSAPTPMPFWTDSGAPRRSQDFANPNWLFLFFLHNQRQMFKEILHEMLSTIQRQNQQSSSTNQVADKTTGQSSNSEDMNEFKQLIQMLQSTIASTATTPTAQQESQTSVVPIETVTANVAVPNVVVVPETKPAKGCSKKGKTKEKKQKEKKSKKNKEQKPETTAPKMEEEKTNNFASDASDGAANSTTTTNTNVKSSNRFVNKIVLNNSINQFNFTMNQDGSPTSTHPPPQASIVNVFNDQSSNQAANMFDVNIGNNNKPEQTEDEDDSEEEEEMNEASQSAGTVVSVQVGEPALPTSPATQHRTVLQIKDPSGRSSGPTGLFSTLRYRLEKKRNKKLMERFKREQLAASQISLLDAIKEAEETTAEVEPKVTLANTSKLEIKVTSPEIYPEQPVDLPQQKMGTLRRLLSPSRNGTSKREKLPKMQLNEADTNSEVADTLDRLVAKHRNSQYIPQISEPCPTGLEYSLFGTIRRNGRELKGVPKDQRGRIPPELIARSPAARSLSERNFRSISVIKLNEMPVDEPVEMIGNHHREFVKNSRAGQMDRSYGGSHLNLSSSSLSSSSIAITGRRAARAGGYPSPSHYRRGYQNHHPPVANSSDYTDFDDEQSTTSSRASKMVTFTLPRSFKPKSRTLHGGGVHHSSADPKRYHHQQQRSLQLRQWFIEEPETASETDFTENDFREETETETDLDEYYLTPCRLNERYFRRHPPRYD